MKANDSLVGLLDLRPGTEVVLIEGEKEWTAEAVRLSVAELERRLRQSGVMPGDRVVLEIPNSAAWVIAAFAVWRIGGTIVPIQDYLRSSAPKIVADCAAVAVLSVSPGQSEEIVSVIRLPGPRVVFAPDIAAIYFTSGTSGEPAGVMLSAENLATNARAVAHALGLRKDDRAFLVLSLGYIYGLSVLLSHWVAGGSIVTERSFAYPVTGLRRIAETQATVFYGVASHYDAMCRWGGIEGQYSGPLRLLAQAGDRMPSELTGKLVRIFGSREIRLMYGQTEASPRITISRSGDALTKPESVGRPIPGVELKIVDESGAPVPAGTAGEIVVRGPGIMKGYWKNPELTAERVRGGWLHTQDIGRLDGDGDLYIEGRRVDSLKIHGLWVLPKKIEEACLAFEGVERARAEEVPDSTTGLTSIQVWLCSLGLKDEDALLRFLKERLSAHERPSKILWVDKLPDRFTAVKTIKRR